MWLHCSEHNFVKFLLIRWLSTSSHMLWLIKTHHAVSTYLLKNIVKIGQFRPVCSFFSSGGFDFNTSGKFYPTIITKKWKIKLIIYVANVDYYGRLCRTSDVVGVTVVWTLTPGLLFTFGYEPATWSACICEMKVKEDHVNNKCSKWKVWSGKRALCCKYKRNCERRWA